MNVVVNIKVWKSDLIWFEKPYELLLDFFVALF